MYWTGVLLFLWLSLFFSTHTLAFILLLMIFFNKWNRDHAIFHFWKLPVHTPAPAIEYLQVYHILREFIDFLNSISCTNARYLCIIMTTGVNKQLLLIFFSATSIISPPLMLIFKCYSASHGRIQTNPPSQKKDF